MMHSTFRSWNLVLATILLFPTTVAAQTTTSSKIDDTLRESIDRGCVGMRHPAWAVGVAWGGTLITDDDNIVWGNLYDDNVVWGNALHFGSMMKWSGGAIGGSTLRVRRTVR